MVDLKQEQFRKFVVGGVYDSSNEGSVNDWGIVREGATIELFWPNADLWFECTVVKYCPLFGSTVDGDGDENKKKKKKKPSAGSMAISMTESAEWVKIETSDKVGEGINDSEETTAVDVSSMFTSIT